MNKFFVVGASLAALLQTSATLHAKFDVYGQELVDASQFGMSFIGIKSKAKVIADTACVASAAYNATEDVKKNGLKPLRKQVGYEDRDQLAQDGQKVVNFSATNEKHGDVPAGIVTYQEDESGKAILTIGYHGSESVEDFTEANLLLHKRDASNLGINGKVHGGFYDRYMESRAAMFNAMMRQLAESGKKIDDVSIRVTGHSLGGALATLCAADLKNLFKEAHVDLVTYCSPRVACDVKTADSIENKVGKENIIRIWRKNDPVPAALLGGILGYKHVGQSVALPGLNIVPGLANHKLTPIIEDALSPEVAKTVKHEGYFAWMKRFGGKAARLFSRS